MARMTLAEAKKKTDAKIKKNRQKYFGTNKSGPPSSNKRLKDTKVGKFFSNLFRGPGKESAAIETKKTKKPGAMPTKKPNIAKLKYGMGSGAGIDSGKVKQGPPKPSSSTKTKKKSSMVDDFKKAVKETKRNFGSGRMKSANERNLDSKGNYKGTNIKPTKLQLSRMQKPKKNTMAKATGPEMMQPKKDDGKAPMYESKGTMGGVKKTKYAAMGMSGKKTKYAAKGMSGKKTKYASKGMKMAKYYAGGGMVFTGR